VIIDFPYVDHYMLIALTWAVDSMPSRYVFLLATIPDRFLFWKSVEPHLSC